MLKDARINYSPGRMKDKVNILVVDDRRENLRALEAILKPLDQNLIMASSGAEALKFLLKNDAAVILLDMEMPDMDGFQTAMLIRKREKSYLTPIIFLTGISKSDLDFTQGYSLGGVDYIFKPFVPDVLRSKVVAFVEMFKQGKEVQRQSSMLKAERDFAAAILDTVAGFVLVLDAAGRILRVNRAFEEGTGYTFDQVRGNFLYEYLEESDAAREFLEEGRGHLECQEYWLTNGNSRRLVSWCCTALNKEVAGQGRLVVTGRDMTELQQRTEELEGFTYSVSHDMRAPVRAIDGFTRILIEEYAGSLDDEGRRLLDIVRQNTEKMGQLIDGLLALSRLGREKLIFMEVDMTELAKTAFEEQKAASGKKRDISFNLGELPAAYGDKRLITQVFHNLFANSIKFTRNQPAATIQVGCQPGAGEDIYFVRDNGVGFDMNHAQKLFGTFQRLHAANEFEGSGIGLATVRRIIERHGGRVWAEAEPNKGATFYFSLPIKEQRKAS
jgi:PAS domain S-box-containing protein